MEGKAQQIAWFKRHQRDGIYNYYEVYSGPGKSRNGYVVAVRFLSDPPSISVEHNFEHDPSGLTGTWCHYEASKPISEQEYHDAYNRALDHSEVKIRP